MGAVFAVLLFHGIGVRVLADGEAVRAVVAFAPPAVEDAEVQAAVATGFHAAGAGGFERAARVVQPNVATGNHLASDVDVIVLNEHKAALQVAVFAEMNDVLDVTFAIIIARVRFAGKDELHRARFVAGEFNDVLHLLENERGSLVGRETARETDSERVGIQQLVERDEVPLAKALALEEQTASSELDQFAAQIVTQGPEFFVGNEIGLGNFLPE